MKFFGKCTIVVLIMIGTCSAGRAQDYGFQNYDIVYITSEDASNDLSLELLQVIDTTSAILVNELETLLYIDRQLGIDAIMIDNQSLDLIDIDWLQEMYSNGVVILTIDLSSQNISDLLSVEIEDVYSVTEDSLFLMLSSFDLTATNEYGLEVSTSSEGFAIVDIGNGDSYDDLYSSLFGQLRFIREQKRIFFRGS